MSRNLGRNTSWPWIDLPLRYLAVFAAFFGYVLLRIDPNLIYHMYVIRAFRSPWAKVDPAMVDHVFGTVPLSMCNESVGGFMSRPGGPVALAAAWVSEYFFISWFGALAITVAAMLVCLMTGELLAALGRRRHNPLVFVPAVLLLVIANQYINPLPMAFGVLVAMAGAVVCLRAPGRSAAASLATFAAVSLAVYYLAGKAYLLTALTVGVYELLKGGRRAVGVVYVLLGVCVPALGAHLTPVALSPSWVGRWLPFIAAENGRLIITLPTGQLTTAPVALVFASLCLGAVLLGVLRAGRPAGPRRIVSLLLTALVVAGGAALVTTLHDPVQHASARLCYLCECRRWDDALREAREFPGHWYSAPLRHDVLRALYHTGQLGEALFSYPQDMEGIALKVQRDERLDCGKLAWSYLELGRVNEAEFIAQNSFETFDDRPAMLKLLAIANVVKGHSEGAKMFLRDLRKYRRYRKEADDMLARLEDDPRLQSDPLIGRIRSVVYDSSATRNHGHIDDRWNDLLRQNPKNHMAFEYLMTYWLLSRQVPDLIGQLSRLDDFGYKAIPYHWQEAILLYESLEQKKVNLGRRSISPIAVARFREFAREWGEARTSADPEAAMVRLTARFGDTYFYYFFFGPGRGEP
ncbi:MAG: hypothetical protein JXL80_11665 [Planctomycetes bacterium]|nr:hypothetical protein [Planctomycetota bacterium]